MSPPSGVTQLKQVKTNESPNKINYETHISYNWIFFRKHLYIIITHKINVNVYFSEIMKGIPTVADGIRLIIKR